MKYPPEHRFLEENFRKVLDVVEKADSEFFDLDVSNLAVGDAERLYLISMFWFSMYGYAKYGIEKLGVGSEDIFRDKEAKLALAHAYECYKTAQKVYVMCGTVTYKNSHYTLELPDPSFELE